MQVQKEVGSTYGLYFALLNSTVILNILLDLGMSNYNNRKISVNNNRFSKYFQNISIIRFGLAILYLLVLQLWGIVAQYTMHDQMMLFFLGLSQVFLSSLLYVRSNLTAFGKYKLDSLFSVLDRALMIAGVLYLFSQRDSGLVNIENFIYVQTIGYGFSFIAGLITLFIIGQPGIPKINKRFARVLLRKSAPYALIVLLMAAYHSSDAIMIERMLSNGKVEASIYAQSMRILLALNNYAYLFAVLLLPMFSKLLAKKEKIQGLIATSSSLLIYGVSSVAILMAFFADDVIALCYGKFNDESIFVDWRLNVEALQNMGDVLFSADVFKLIIYGIIPMSINYCFGTLITASGNMKLLNKIAFASLLLNIVLNFALIPKYGAWGAALASLITQSFSGAFQVVFAIKLFKLKVNLIGVARFFLGVAIILLSTIFLDEINLSSRLPVMFGLLLIGLLLAVNFRGVLNMAKGFRNNHN